jgi:putative tryptophan/tyrosine transport system substrate-binding protein
MKRREFIAGLGAAAWPLTARAQQGGRVGRIGVLMGADEDDPQRKGWLSAFTQGLAGLGWTGGRNLRVDVRWAGEDVDRMGIFAKELVDLQPDVIFSHTTPVTAALQRQTRTIPIVFTFVGDPEGEGFVAGLPRPGGNITGFIPQEASMAGKWVELLTEIAPGVKRVAAMFNPDTEPFVRRHFLPSFETAARSFNVVPIVEPIRSEAEIEKVMISLGREPGGSFVPMPDAFVQVHRTLIILLAARYSVPGVYQLSLFAREGGLLSYGADGPDVFRRAASYVDRILRGAKPADLPVQLPVKMEMVVNLKTAKALGLTIPPNLLTIADEVIE